MKLLGLVALVVVVWLLLKSKSQASIPNVPVSGNPMNPPATAPPNSPVTVGDGLDNISEAIARFEQSNPAYNNPGALENKQGQFVTYADQGDGWDALNSYVTRHAAANPTWDFYDFFQNYLGQKQGGATVTDQGNSDAYAEYVAGYLGVDPTQTVSSVLNGA